MGFVILIAPSLTCVARWFTQPNRHVICRRPTKWPNRPNWTAFLPHLFFDTVCLVILILGCTQPQRAQWPDGQLGRISQWIGEVMRIVDAGCRLTWSAGPISNKQLVRVAKNCTHSANSKNNIYIYNYNYKIYIYIYILRPPTGWNLGLNWNSSLFCDWAEK